MNLQSNEMADNLLADDAPSNAVGATLELFHREKAAMAEQRKEIAVLIKQAAAEIDRLTQRNRETSSRVRQLEANLESFSRTEIKQIYSLHQEAQMRLFMMQNQLEQLRNRQSNHERTEQLLEGFLEMAESLLRLSQYPTSEAPSVATQNQTPSAGRHDLIDSVETVRLRLSRQLQDGIAQAISDLILRIEVCERLIAVDLARGRDELSRLKAAASLALKSIRQLIYELQPPALEEIGLSPALQKYIDTFQSAKNLPIDLQISGQEARLDTGIKLGIFRILQEALANAAEHSGASRLAITIQFEANRILASVHDKGRGFDAEAALAESVRNRYSGLADMKAQAAAIGAALEVVSSPGAGCTVRLSVPI